MIARRTVPPTARREVSNQPILQSMSLASRSGCHSDVAWRVGSGHQCSMINAGRPAALLRMAVRDVDIARTHANLGLLPFAVDVILLAVVHNVADRITGYAR